MKNLWKSYTGNIIKALIASLIIPVVLILVICIAIAMLHSRTNIYNIRGSLEGEFALLGLLVIVGLLAAIGVFIWYMVNLSRFAGLQADPQDKDNIKKVFNAHIINIVGSICIFGGVMFFIYMVPQYALTVAKITPWCTLLLSIIISSMMISAYKNLSGSLNFGDRCRDGFDCLRVSAVLGLIIVVISFVSEILGGIPGDLKIRLVIQSLCNIFILILGIISIVRTFQGWSRIKNDCPYEE